MHCLQEVPPYRYMYIYMYWYCGTSILYMYMVRVQYMATRATLTGHNRVCGQLIWSYNNNNNREWALRSDQTRLCPECRHTPDYWLQMQSISYMQNACIMYVYLHVHVYDCRGQLMHAGFQSMHT